MKKNLLNISLASLTALVTVWGVFVVFEWGEVYFATKQSPAYESVPFEFKLKADAKDVLYAEAYETEQGGEVKYAYVTDVVPAEEGEAVERRTPVSRTEVLAVQHEGNKKIETLKTEFFSKPQFYERDGQWRQIEYATTTPEAFAASGAIKYVKKREWLERFLPGQPVFAATATFYPDPNTETTSVDGQASYDTGLSFYFGTSDACDDASIASGDTASDAATTISVSATLTAVDNAPFLENSGEDEYSCSIRRGFFLFDTSSLPDSAIISAASISYYVISKSDYSSMYVGAVTSNPSSNTAITSTDYATVGIGNLISSTSTIDSITTSSYNTFSLNSTGIAAVSLTSITKTALLLGPDIVGALWPFLSSGIDTFGVTVSAAETSGTSQDPKLDVTYTATSFSFGQWFPF